MSMTDAEIREALARAERATPGEARIIRRSQWSDTVEIGDASVPGSAHAQWTSHMPSADLDFWISARTDVPRLAADLLAARAERDEFQKRLVDVEVGKETIDAVNRAETAERERDEARAAWAEGAAALVEGQKRLEAELVVARAQLSERVIAPDRCPLTGLPFFMAIDGIATYGGPYDSYTIPTRDDDETYTRSHYDHDEGGWSEDERIGLTVLSEEAEEARGEAIARAEAAEARCRELEGFVRGFLHASSGTRDENAAALLSRFETRAQVLLSPPSPHTCQIHRATSGASDCGLSPCEEATVHTDRGAARPKMRCAICGLVEHVGRCASSPPTSPEAAPVEADTAPEAVKCATCGGGEWVLDPPHAPDCDTPVPAGIRHSHRLVWCKCGARGHECPDCGGGA